LRRTGNHATRTFCDLKSQIKNPGFLLRILSPPGPVEKIVKTQVSSTEHKSHTGITKPSTPSHDRRPRGANALNRCRDSPLRRQRFSALKHRRDSSRQNASIGSLRRGGRSCSRQPPPSFGLLARDPSIGFDKLREVLSGHRSFSARSISFSIPCLRRTPFTAPICRSRSPKLGRRTWQDWRGEERCGRTKSD
jgi:hypothetical protein